MMMRVRALLATVVAGLSLLVAPVQAASASTATKAPVIVLGCYASVSNAHPKQHTVQKISISQMGAGVKVNVVIHYRTLNVRRVTVGSAQGLASTSFNVGHATHGYRVPVTVSASRGNLGWSCSTSFITR
jgi:hypothetical protein